jgi:hypothetical protein
MSPTGRRISKPPGRRSGSRPAARSTASSARSARAARWPAWRMALQPKGVKIGLADPEGAALHSFYTTGELESPGSSITEGIGQGRITANLEGFTPDFSYRIPDAEALPIIFDLLTEEGLCLGGSTGINIAGAIRMAREMGPGHTIVTILCDYGTPLSVQALQPDLPAREGPAGAGMAGPRALGTDSDCGAGLARARRRQSGLGRRRRRRRAASTMPSGSGWPKRPKPRSANAAHLDRTAGGNPGSAGEVAGGAFERAKRQFGADRHPAPADRRTGPGPCRRRKTEAEEIAAPTRELADQLVKAAGPRDRGGRGLSPRRRADPTRSTAPCANARRTSCCSSGPRP